MLAGASGGANALWLAEWLAEGMDLRPGMRVLDLGCGRAQSSIFLHREFGVQVWAVDLWYSAADNLARIHDAGVENGVFPVHADARALPFAAEFFDAIVSIDSYPYYGTDHFYAAMLARLAKPGALIGIAGAGLTREIDGSVPTHLAPWWTPEVWALHSAAWWRTQWERSGVLSVETADTLTDGWRFWRDWQLAVAPANRVEIEALEADAGRHLGYVRCIARRRDTPIDEPTTSVPADYVRARLLRD